jgi:uncharacterized protein YggE
MSHDDPFAIHAPNTEHVAVVGEARIDVVPDLVELTFEVKRIDETMADAKADVDERSGKVIALARRLGIETRDINATELRCAPYREYRNREILPKGYSADRTIMLRLRDLTRFNELTNELVHIPIDLIEKIDRQLADPVLANKRALEEAIQDAKTRAAHLAEQFGVKLGRVYSLRALPKVERFHIGGAAARAREEDATFEPGTIEVESRVSVCYYLER